MVVCTSLTGEESRTTVRKGKVNRYIKIHPGKSAVTRTDLGRFFDIVRRQYDSYEQPITILRKSIETFAKAGDMPWVGNMCALLWPTICSNRCHAQLKDVDAFDETGTNFCMVVQKMLIDDYTSAQSLLRQYAEELLRACQCISGNTKTEPIPLTILEELLAVCHILEDAALANCIFREEFLALFLSRVDSASAAESKSLINTLSLSFQGLLPTKKNENGVTPDRIQEYSRTLSGHLMDPRREPQFEALYEVLAIAFVKQSSTRGLLEFISKAAKK